MMIYMTNPNLLKAELIYCQIYKLKIFFNIIQWISHSILRKTIFFYVKTFLIKFKIYSLVSLKAISSSFLNFSFNLLDNEIKKEVYLF